MVKPKLLVSGVLLRDKIQYEFNNYYLTNLEECKKEPRLSFPTKNGETKGGVCGKFYYLAFSTFGLITISILLFFALPSSVLLFAIGFAPPSPAVVIFLDSAPIVESKY